MEITYTAEGTVIKSLDFNLAQTFDCGQSFRFSLYDGVWSGIAGGYALRARQENDIVTLIGVSQSEFESFWIDYFDLKTDYTEIKKRLCLNPTLSAACCYGQGIRILRQEPFEMLITFILSQNNNIKRIKGIVQRLCESFGEPSAVGFLFPTPERLAKANLTDLEILRAGFRAKYILDAAQKVYNGIVDFASVRAKSYEEAKAELMKINGVGPKVADCVLLFGFYRLEAFPLDVWMNRAMEQLFPDGLPDCAIDYAGIAQQYLFHFVKEGNGLG